MSDLGHSRRLLSWLSFDWYLIRMWGINIIINNNYNQSGFWFINIYIASGCAVLQPWFSYSSVPDSVFVFRSASDLHSSVRLKPSKLLPTQFLLLLLRKRFHFSFEKLVILFWHHFWLLQGLNDVSGCIWIWLHFLKAQQRCLRWLDRHLCHLSVCILKLWCKTWF